MHRHDIVLVRHGEPDCATRGRLARDAFVDWLAAYAAAGVSREPSRASPCRAAARDARTIFASDSPRARDSATILAGERLVKTNAIFREAEIAIPPFGLALPPQAWTAAGRLSWLLGAASPEGVSSAKARAARAADLLCAEAATGGVLLVGHGWMNRMIGQALLSRGMRKMEKTGPGYWSLTRFREQ